MIHVYGSVVCCKEKDYNLNFPLMQQKTRRLHCFQTVFDEARSKPHPARVCYEKDAQFWQKTQAGSSTLCSVRGETLCVLLSWIMLNLGMLMINCC